MSGNHLDYFYCHDARQAWQPDPIVFHYTYVFYQWNARDPDQIFVLSHLDPDSAMERDEIKSKKIANLFRLGASSGSEGVEKRKTTDSTKKI